MKELCIDTYALWEIIQGNPKFSFLLNEEMVITEWTLLELYKTMIKSFDKSFSLLWIEKFRPFSRTVNFETLMMSVDFFEENKKKNLSLFDCVGYIYSKTNNLRFVTGDKEFKDMENVLFITK